MKPETKPDISVTSHNQQGGITANTVEDSINSQSLNASSIEGNWTKLGVIVAIVTLVTSLAFYILKK